MNQHAKLKINKTVQNSLISYPLHTDGPTLIIKKLSYEYKIIILKHFLKPAGYRVGSLLYLNQLTSFVKLNLYFKVQDTCIEYEQELTRQIVLMFDMVSGPIGKL